MPGCVVAWERGSVGATADAFRDVPARRAGSRRGIRRCRIPLANEERPPADPTGGRLVPML
jgi:hypothetical protein